MAHIIINDVIDVGTGGYPNAISVEIAEDAAFTKLIDSTYKNKQPVLDAINYPIPATGKPIVAIWYSMLPKQDGSGYYADLNSLYSRVKVFVDDNESDWFILDTKNQNIQDVIITEDGEDTIYTTSIAIGMI